MLTLSTIIQRGKHMQMKNPPHPGELLGDNLAELGWSVTAAAKGLGFASPVAQHYCWTFCDHAGKVVKLEKAIGSTADAWGFGCKVRTI
jgi:antitoxin HigA-1